MSNGSTVMRQAEFPTSACHSLGQLRLKGAVHSLSLAEEKKGEQSIFIFSHVPICKVMLKNPLKAKVWYLNFSISALPSTLFFVFIYQFTDCQE